MKKIFILLAAVSLCSIISARTRLASGTVVYPENACGLDKLYDFNTPELTPAPEGYSPLFIEHYGRHGSRYAYSPVFYTGLMEVLDTALRMGVLTPFGKDLMERYSIHYQNYIYRMGDLTTRGWEQLGRIGREMYSNFPEVFPENAVVFASASSSFRSVMSMSSFCLGLKSACPSLEIREEQGRVFLDGTNPRDSGNPFQKLRKEPPFPFSESLGDFQRRRVDSRAVLSRLFSDVGRVCGDRDADELVRDLYVLVSGMNSLDDDLKTDFSGLFTDKEYALMWEVDNYQRYIEYFPYIMRVIPVTLDFVKDAAKRLERHESGATLRFGHDHVMMPLMILMGVNGFENMPDCPDNVSKYFKSWESPMATNTQIVFYVPDGEGDVLVKVIQNGREASLAIDDSMHPYYKWSDFAAFMTRFEKDAFKQ